MKTLLIVCLALTLACAMFVPQAMAKGKKVKVEICHATDFFDVEANEWTQVVGHVIEVSANALPAHFAHGDFVYEDQYHIDEDSGLWGLTWRQVAENNGLDLEDVDCSGFVHDLD